MDNLGVLQEALDMKRQIKRSSRTLKDSQPISGMRKSFRFLVQSLVGAGFLALVLVGISYFFLYPQVMVKVERHEFAKERILAYDIFISNPSNQNISNLSFGFRFDEKYPISKLSIRDTMYKSGISLRLHDITIHEVPETNKVGYVRYRSGFTAETDKFVSEAQVLITALQDTTYHGEWGDVFPPLGPPELRTNSYYISYKYNPLGILSPFFLSKSGCYDFSGRKTLADNFRSYTQKVRLPDGPIESFTLDVKKK